MEITITDFAAKGTGWYLRLNDMTVGIIMPSDLPKIVKVLRADSLSQKEVKVAVDAHYAQLGGR